MSQTDVPVEHDSSVRGPDHASGTRDSSGQRQNPATGDLAGHQRPGIFAWVAAVIVCAFALVLLSGGAWGLWEDRVDREGGFVPIGTTELHTETYAIISELRGDGPGWLYGSKVLGDARVRATSLSDRPLFIGIAPTGEVSRYLDGVGHGTIEHLATGELSATHEGGPPSSPPGQALDWAASTDGTGEQTLVWKPRDGDWSIVLMNVDSSAGVDLKGNLGAEFPPLPWLAGGLLIAGAVFAILGGWLVVRMIPRRTRGRGDATPLQV